MGGITVTQVLSERKFRAGYVIRHEIWEHGTDNPPVTLKAAYNLRGDYIGSSREAYRLCVKRGIKPEKARPEHSVCSIGFSERGQKWYGWSHRAIFGFGIGHVVKEGDCAASEGWTDEYLAMHPEASTALPVGFTAHTLDDAKRIAIAFAESVS